MERNQLTIFLVYGALIALLLLLAAVWLTSHPFAS